MPRAAILTLATFCILIPHLLAGEDVADVVVFEIVAGGGALNQEQRKRATELWDAWQASEAHPVEREDPRLGEVLEAMALKGALTSEEHRRVAAGLAREARRRIGSAGQGLGPLRVSQGADDGAGGGPSGYWLRDLAVVVGFAAAIVLAGIVVAQIEKRVRTGARAN